MTDKEAWAMFAASRASGKFDKYTSEFEKASVCTEFADEMLERMRDRWIGNNGKLVAKKGEKR